VIDFICPDFFVGLVIGKKNAETIFRFLLRITELFRLERALVAQ